MKIMLNGDIVIFDDRFFNKTSSNENYLEDSLEGCDCGFFLDEDECEEPEEYIDGMLEHYSELIAGIDSCPNCIKAILIQFMDEVLDMIEDDIKNECK